MPVGGSWPRIRRALSRHRRSRPMSALRSSRSRPAIPGTSPRPSKAGRGARRATAWSSRCGSRRTGSGRMPTSGIATTCRAGGRSSSESTPLAGRVSPHSTTTGSLPAFPRRRERLTPRIASRSMRSSTPTTSRPPGSESATATGKSRSRASCTSGSTTRNGPANSTPTSAPGPSPARSRPLVRKAVLNQVSVVRPMRLTGSIDRARRIGAARPTASGRPSSRSTTSSSCPRGNRRRSA